MTWCVHRFVSLSVNECAEARFCEFIYGKGDDNTMCILSFVTLSVNESAKAVIRHNVYQHKNIATITVDDNVELLTDDTTLLEGLDKLMTS